MIKDLSRLIGLVLFAILVFPDRETRTAVFQLLDVAFGNNGGERLAKNRIQRLEKQDEQDQQYLLLRQHEQHERHLTLNAPIRVPSEFITQTLPTPVKSTKRGKKSGTPYVAAYQRRVRPQVAQVTRSRRKQRFIEPSKKANDIPNWAAKAFNSD